MPLILDEGLDVADLGVQQQLVGLAGGGGRGHASRRRGQGREERPGRVIDIFLLAVVADAFEPDASLQDARGAAQVHIALQVEDVAKRAVVVVLHITDNIARGSGCDAVDRVGCGAPDAKVVQGGNLDGVGANASAANKRLVRAVVLQAGIPVGVGIGAVIDLDPGHIGFKPDIFHIRGFFRIVIADILLGARIAVHSTVGFAIREPLRRSDRAYVVVIFSTAGRQSGDFHVTHLLFDFDEALIDLVFTELQGAVGGGMGHGDQGARVAGLLAARLGLNIGGEGAVVADGLLD